MAERYTRVFTATNNLYALGSPVILSAGALLKDNQTGKILAQLKIRSIADKTIKALTLNISSFDTSGAALGEDVSFEYLDLSAARDEEFGQKTLIPLPNASTRAFDVTVTKVIFEDNDIWENGQKFALTVSEPISLASILQDDELLKQYAMHFNQTVAKPEKVHDLWYCACGALNHREEAECPVCGNKLESLLACDFDALKSECTERLAKEKAEKAAAEEAKRIKREKAAKETKRVLSIVIPVICAAIAIVLVITKVIIPNNKYNAAVALIDQEKYEEAYKSLIALHGYKDSKQKAADIYDKYIAEKLGDRLKIDDNGEYIITLGTYEQDNNIANGKEDIEWLVLDKWSNGLIVISKYALDCKQYNTYSTYALWETCSLRTWLNGTFIDEAFTEEEQAIMQPPEVFFDEDKIFVLSNYEANEYFASDEARMCVPTAYAIANGAWTCDGFKVDGKATCYWWLSSAGKWQDCAEYVLCDGSVIFNGLPVDSDYFGVRPAMYIDLDAIS
jgi:hypothetical protein